MKTHISLFLQILLLCNAGLQAKTISGLGWIEPAGGIIDLVGPGNDTIADIYVKLGQKVKSGQILATFYGTTQIKLQLKAERFQEKTNSQLFAQAITLQQLAVQNAENNLTNAKQHYEAYKTINTKAIIQRELELRKYQFEKARIGLKTAKAQLDELHLSNSLEVKLTALNIDRTRDLLKRTTLFAPVNGEILTIEKSPGESSSHGPILKMANLDNIIVICEVAEDELINLKKGQSATIESAALPENINGVVQSVERIIDQRLKVGHVIVKLENTELAARFINMQVTFKINT